MFSSLFDIIYLLISTQKLLLSYHLSSDVTENKVQDDFQMRPSSHGNPYLKFNGKLYSLPSKVVTSTQTPTGGGTDNSTSDKSFLKVHSIPKIDNNYEVQEGVLSLNLTQCPCEDGYKCILGYCTVDVNCPAPLKFGEGPPRTCIPPKDPNNKPSTDLEKWFTKDIFLDLFPKANIGWGPDSCWPYSYEAFVIAARYFPQFGTESPQNGYDTRSNNRRDVATFFAHAVQETGENDASLYETFKDSLQKANACFYRGGFYNWFEGGPTSSFLHRDSPGYQPEDGDQCFFNGLYCPLSDVVNAYFYPCNNATKEMPDGSSQKPTKFYKGCYFGRGAIQISYNFNYKQFQDWLDRQGIVVDLLTYPNLVMTKMDPPLAILASLWFYMTPQPPKPAMHDIILGNWNPGPINEAANYVGPILGPTSLVINNECNGEDAGILGGPGESRRIKAFKWFCQYFGVEVGEERTLTCKNMPQQLNEIKHNVSWQPDWTTSWKEVPCACAPAPYGGSISYFQPEFYPLRFVDENERNRAYCVFTIYDEPALYGMENSTSACLNQPMADTDIRGQLEEVTFKSRT